MLRMDWVHVIRHKHFLEGKSIRRVAREMGISRNTVKKYVLGDGEPQRKESGPRVSPVRDEVAKRVEAILEAWSERTTEKQRITATRVHRQLVEDGHEVGITTVREYMAERRRPGCCLA